MSTNQSISQPGESENGPSRDEREVVRRRQAQMSLASQLQDHKTLRALAHNARDRDGKQRIIALLDTIYDLREELVAWAEANALS